MTKIQTRLAAVRAAMQKHQLDAYLFPSNDPHQSEYVADHWKTREWISGFDGSAGIVIVTQDHAGLWTDSRYFLQAEEQLQDSPVQLHKQKVAHAPEHVQWLVDELPKGATVGVDGKLFSSGQLRYLAKHFYKKDLTIKSDIDLAALCWTDRPALPLNDIFEHKLNYAGQSRSSKLAEVKGQLQQKECSHYLVSTLDDIAWVLNLRGSDVECNPVFVAYLLIEEEKSILFVNGAKIASSLANKLSQDNVILKEYDLLDTYLQELPEDARVWIDAGSTSVHHFNLLSATQRYTDQNIIRPLKAIKNETEIGHIRNVMVKDGVALVKLYRWLDAELDAGNTPTEYELAMQLANFRKARGDYFGESFNAIAGYQGNGAIVHYRPQPDSSAAIKPKGILLLDSGGQYLNGTTDITRTTTLGTPTPEQQTAYTAVLKGHIALARIQFPEGTSGAQLDTLARMYLWQQGKNYGHGTGHGVGFFLNVHEPPQGFTTSAATSRGSTGFKAGMFTSNEPGYYETDAYGIRIENLILCVEKETTDSGTFLAFETLTLFPIDTKLIDRNALQQEEAEWLNNYHQQVYDKLAPELDEAEQQWLAEKCRAI